MALCSQAFNSSTKRSCNYNNQTPSKRLCLSNLSSYKLNTSSNSVVYSSSENDNDSEDEQSCYNADQIKAKRRASNRVSFSLNSELSKAISKYSDDDSESEHHEVNENIDCKLSSSPATTNCTKKFLQISDSNCSNAIRKPIPDSDKCSRSRCFEYLVGAIDEAWARYCDATTYVEDEVYGYNTPASIATDDEDFFDNTTDITDYDSDFELSHQQKDMSSNLSNCSGASKSSSTSCKPSNDPSSCQLQALKDRLTKAKYFLQDLVDSDDYNDANAFWKRWDMIKYATIELVEDDDDDEIVESTIDELEDGRIFAN